jgi:hypothetical protein
MESKNLANEMSAERPQRRGTTEAVPPAAHFRVLWGATPEARYRHLCGGFVPKEASAQRS